MSIAETYFDSTIARDFFRLFAGKQLGYGAGRVVFECLIKPDFVIKVENGSKSFQNVMEWETWMDLKHEKQVARWLAPCEEISQCGTVLLMRRTEVPREKDFPERMPTFLTDTKRTNFGMLGKRFVCHDYGMTRLASLGASMRTRKVDWWDE